MITKSTQRVFIPLMMMAFLLVGALAAQAQEYRDGDRVAKGAAIGATVGTLFQMIQGRTEGHQLLKGAIVGGAVGAVAGAYDNAQHDRYDAYYGDGQDDAYYQQQDGRDYQDGYNQDGYVVQGYAYPNVYAYPNGYEHREYRGGHDGYRHDSDSRESRPVHRYDHGARYDDRAPRHCGDYYGHR